MIDPWLVGNQPKFRKDLMDMDMVIGNLSCLSRVPFCRSVGQGHDIDMPQGL
jgi:hypothetical protein